MEKKKSVCVGEQILQIAGQNVQLVVSCPKRRTNHELMI